MNDLAPITLFVYNRLEHTKQTIQALQKNVLAKKSILYIYSDGAKNESNNESVQAVREYIKGIDGFKEIIIIERTNNLGLGKNIINGVTEVLNNHGKTIILEDDLITSPFFIEYMNEGLYFYRDIKKVYSICGFCPEHVSENIPDNYEYDVFCNTRNESQGWGTWKNRWEKVDWLIKDYNEFKKDREKQREFNRAAYNMTEMLKLQMKGIIDSWAIRWDYHIFKNNGVSIFPVNSLIRNIGYDGTGRHSRKTNKYDSKIVSGFKVKKVIADPVIDSRITNLYYQVYNRSPFFKITKKIYNFIRIHLIFTE